MKLSEEAQDQLLTDLAYAARSYMTELGAVREVDNVEPVWVRTDDLCQAIGTTQTMWKAVRERMIELGIPLSLAYFGGYYIGKDGEQSTLLKHKQSMIQGIAHSFNEDIMAMARDGRTMEDVEKFAMQRLAMELKDIPKMLRALSVPLPAPLEMRLLEASKKVYSGPDEDE